MLLLVGPEPDMAWHRFTTTVGELADGFGVQSMTALGAYPFATPHTRPHAGVSVTSPSAPTSCGRWACLPAPSTCRQAWPPPSSEQLHGQGIPAAGHLGPGAALRRSHVVPGRTVALPDGLQQVTGVEIPARVLRREVAVQRERLDDLVASNDEHAAMVARSSNCTTTAT